MNSKLSDFSTRASEDLVPQDLVGLDAALGAVARADAAAATPGLEDRLTARAMTAFDGHGTRDTTGAPDVLARIEGASHEARFGTGLGRWRLRGVLAAAASVALCAGAILMGLRTGTGAFGTGTGGGQVAAMVEVDVDTMLAALTALDAGNGEGVGAALLQDADTFESTLRGASLIDELDPDNL